MLLVAAILGTLAGALATWVALRPRERGVPAAGAGGRAPRDADPRVARARRERGADAREGAAPGLRRPDGAAADARGGERAPALRDRKPGDGAPGAGRARPLGSDAAPPRRRDGRHARLLRLPRAGLGGGRRLAPARPRRQAARRPEPRGGREGPAPG